MTLVNVALAADMKPNQMKAVKINDKSILLVNLEGAYYAIGDKCTHRGCSLSKGKLEGEMVQCPCHKSKFNVKTGEVVGGPAKAAEPKYEVKVEDGKLFINA
ncbi:MAG: Rieske (2Fe-2S) protein [Candidatus Bathyarchaeota archaeon]|nr:Rieske (2Fe-2S) protein [Candidatus Bathyarchaeota archaeon]